MPKFELPASLVLALSDSGRLCAASGRKITLANLETKSRVNAAFLLANTSRLAFSPSERLLATKNTSGEMMLVEIPSMKVLVSRLGVYEEGSEVHFSSCGEYLIDGNWRGRFSVSRVFDLSIVAAWNDPNELVSDVSSDTTKAKFLSSHKPRTPIGRNFGDPPYLKLWSWPFAQDPRRIDVELDILYGAQLAPCGKYLAVLGYSRPESRTLLRVMGIEGEIRESREIRELPYRMRWVRKDIVVLVSSDRYVFYSVPGLEVVKELEEAFASDVMMLNNEELLIGTTKRGFLVPW